MPDFEVTAMTTKTAVPTDEEIQQDVIEELKWDARVQPNEIGVAVKDGIVTLTGWVDSYLKRWAAQEAAHRVHGVKAVVNEIEVRLPISAERTDVDIAAAATRALEWHALSLDKIDVTVSKGWITLRGEVEWNFQKEAAERAVRSLSGVRGVTNLIVVKPQARPTAEQIKKRIEAALMRNAETTAEKIHVDVEGDKVILRGEVHSYADKQEAERAAWSAPGVASVDNRLVIVV
jgi:osmotically-inducible protein OsmY